MEGQSAAQTKLLQRHSDHAIAVAQNLVSAYDVRVKHSQAMMSLDEKIQAIDSAHGVKVSDYQIKSAENVEYLNGYQQQMRLADNVIDI